MGVDAVEVEAELRRELDQARWASGQPSLLSDAGLDEMARHHAHFLARNLRDTPQDDHGRDVNGRRLVLYPELLGPLTEARALIEETDPRSAVTALLELLVPVWSESRWTAGAVGVAAVQQHLAACVVLARRVLILEEAPWVEDATHPGEAWIGDATVHLQGIAAEAANSSSGFTLKTPDGNQVSAPQERNSRGRIALTLHFEAEGVHELLVDGDVIFIFRFGDHR